MAVAMRQAAGVANSAVGPLPITGLAACLAGSVIVAHVSQRSALAVAGLAIAGMPALTLVDSGASPGGAFFFESTYVGVVPVGGLGAAPNYTISIGNQHRLSVLELTGVSAAAYALATFGNSGFGQLTNLPGVPFVATGAGIAVIAGAAMRSGDVGNMTWTSGDGFTVGNQGLSGGGFHPGGWLAYRIVAAPGRSNDSGGSVDTTGPDTYRVAGFVMPEAGGNPGFAGAPGGSVW